MPKDLKKNKANPLYRIIDANANRAKEGLRVCEEVMRFVLNKRGLTAKIKRIRHRLHSTLESLKQGDLELLKERDSAKDVGRLLSFKENKRNGIRDIFFANIQRVKESLRVLEEFSKLINKNSARNFKSIRYKIYEIEKEVAKKF